MSIKKQNSDWYQFQENICNHLKQLGLKADTNITVQGLRAKHDIDILVKSKHFGFDFMWLIEAKHWNTKIPKERVATMMSIIGDIGAEKGFIISKKGFQSGAISLANKTNISLMTFDEFIDATQNYIHQEILKTYRRRLTNISLRYWSHSKNVRIEYNLRHQKYIPEKGFSVTRIMRTAKHAIENSLLGLYPIELDTHLSEKHGTDTGEDFYQVINWLNLNLNFIDEKILEAEALMIKKRDFNPDIEVNDVLRDEYYKLIV